MDRDAWDARYSGDELLWSAEPNLFLAEEAAPLTPGHALDLACGEGRNAVWLAERGWRVTGVDFSASALDKARGLERARGVDVTWVLADLREYQPDPAGFDLVAVLYLHLPAELRGQVIRRAARALAAGGTLLVVGHDASNLTEGVGGPQDPSVLFTPSDVVGDLAGLDHLRVERAEVVTRPVTVDGTARLARDALVRARAAPELPVTPSRAERRAPRSRRR